MAIIAINQQLGSRGDELGLRVADALGYRFWGRREMVSAASRAYNVQPDQFLIIDEHQPHFWERPKVDADRLRAFLRATLFKEIAQDRMVFASSRARSSCPPTDSRCGYGSETPNPVHVKVQRGKCPLKTVLEECHEPYKDQFQFLSPQ